MSDILKPRSGKGVRFDVHPVVCVHKQVKYHSDFVPGGARTTVNCRDCRVKVTIDIPASMYSSGNMPAIQTIEHIARRALVSAIKQAVERGKSIEVKGD